jgi:nucleotidyltransferase substrate binding protein (TIGR01987 family)
MENIRWLQRFENFEKAFRLLSDALTKGVRELSDLEKEGVVQRFEYTFELAWKTLKDYLEYDGVIIDVSTPRSVIKKAFAAGIVKDGQAWIDMLESRNVMSHTYDEEVFEKSITEISENYFAVIKELYIFFDAKRS